MAASLRSDSYADYLVGAMANTWTRNLGIDGYFAEFSANFGCETQTDAHCSWPLWSAVVDRVRALEPQIVLPGAGYDSWDAVIHANADFVGLADRGYHDRMQQAVLDGVSRSHLLRRSRPRLTKACLRRMQATLRRW